MKTRLKSLFRLCNVAAILLVANSASAFCFEEAGARYDINPDLLKAIAMTESSMRPGAIGKVNSDGSQDFGLMQINDFWFPILASHGITKKDLFEPCQSVMVGAWVLAQSMQIFGKTWEAVGAYNAGTGKSQKVILARRVYQKKVYKNFVSLRGQSK